MPTKQPSEQIVTIIFSSSSFGIVTSTLGRAIEDIRFSISSGRIGSPMIDPPKRTIPSTKARHSRWIDTLPPVSPHVDDCLWASRVEVLGMLKAREKRRAVRWTHPSGKAGRWTVRRRKRTTAESVTLPKRCWTQPASPRHTALPRDTEARSISVRTSAARCHCRI